MRELIKLFDRQSAELNYAFLTLGCNVDKDLHIPFVLKELVAVAVELKQTALMTTTPIDFSYPSEDFANIGFILSTSLGLDDFKAFLKRLEEDCGRTEKSSRLNPELVPMDLDLIQWNASIVKPKDLKRGYVQDSLAYFGLKI